MRIDYDLDTRICSVFLGQKEKDELQREGIASFVRRMRAEHSAAAAVVINGLEVWSERLPGVVLEVVP